MAGTIPHLYDANQAIFVITKCSDAEPLVTAVRPGTIIRIRAEVLLTSTNLYYDVRIAGQSGTTELVEADVFSTLALAVTEYQTRLT